LLPYTGFNGYLTARKNTIDGNIKSTTDSITRIQTKIERDSQVLRNRYIQLQSQLSTLLNSTGSFGADLFS
jgi:flagellar capping protein FliD